MWFQWSIFHFAIDSEWERKPFFFYSYLFHQSNVLRNLKAFYFFFRCLLKWCDEIERNKMEKRWNQHIKKAFSQRGRRTTQMRSFSECKEFVLEANSGIAWGRKASRLLRVVDIRVWGTWSRMIVEFLRKLTTQLLTRVERNFKLS